MGFHVLWFFISSSQLYGQIDGNLALEIHWKTMEKSLDNFYISVMKCTGIHVVYFLYTQGSPFFFQYILLLTDKKKCIGMFSLQKLRRITLIHVFVDSRKFEES